jgi:hypothetical protein
MLTILPLPDRVKDGDMSEDEQNKVYLGFGAGAEICVNKSMDPEHLQGS